MMIQMMDRNRNGKLDKREMGMMDLDELMKNPEVDQVRAYLPDLDALVKKVRGVELNRQNRAILWQMFPPTLKDSME